MATCLDNKNGSSYSFYFPCAHYEGQINKDIFLKVFPFLSWILYLFKILEVLSSLKLAYLDLLSQNWWTKSLIPSQQ